jgi:hypothetical protein
MALSFPLREFCLPRSPSPSLRSLPGNGWRRRDISDRAGWEVATAWAESIVCYNVSSVGHRNGVSGHFPAHWQHCRHADIEENPGSESEKEHSYLFFGDLRPSANNLPGACDRRWAQLCSEKGRGRFFGDVGIWSHYGGHGSFPRIDLVIHRDSGATDLTSSPSARDSSADADHNGGPHARLASHRLSH